VYYKLESKYKKSSKWFKIKIKCLISYGMRLIVISHIDINLPYQYGKFEWWEGEMWRRNVNRGNVTRGNVFSGKCKSEKWSTGIRSAGNSRENGPRGNGHTYPIPICKLTLNLIFENNSIENLMFICYLRLTLDEKLN
jgi:hypothetical protein